MSDASELHAAIDRLTAAETAPTARCAAASSLQNLIRHEGEHPPSAAVLYLLDHLVYSENDATSTEAVAESCLVRPAAGARQVDTLIEGLYYAAAPMPHVRSTPYLGSEKPVRREVLQMFSTILREPKSPLRSSFSARISDTSSATAEPPRRQHDWLSVNSSLRDAIEKSFEHQLRNGSPDAGCDW